MNRLLTRMIAVLLCAAVIVSTSPVSVRAAGEVNVTETYSVIDTVVSEAYIADADEGADSTAAEVNSADADAATEADEAEQTEEKLSFTERLAAKFATSLGKYIPSWLVVLLVSMMPILELRAGLFVAKFLDLKLAAAIPICIIGNIIPIPFILLFIKKIFKWMGKTKLFHKLIDKLEKRAMKKSSALKKGEFWGLVLFVGIPIPGTGAWMGSLIAALLEIDFKKAIAAELVGIVIATIIISLLSYVLLGMFI